MCTCPFSCTKLRTEKKRTYRPCEVSYRKTGRTVPSEIGVRGVGRNGPAEPQRVGRTCRRKDVRRSGNRGQRTTVIINMIDEFDLGRRPGRTDRGAFSSDCRGGAGAAHNTSSINVPAVSESRGRGGDRDAPLRSGLTAAAGANVRGIAIGRFPAVTTAGRV